MEVSALSRERQKRAPGHKPSAGASGFTDEGGEANHQRLASGVISSIRFLSRFLLRAPERQLSGRESCSAVSHSLLPETLRADGSRRRSRIGAGGV